MKALFLGLVLAMVLPASAGAVTYTVIPPTNSGGDQYVESLPTASGNRSTVGVVRGETRAPAGKSGASGSSTAPVPISPATQSALVHQGRVGRRTAALARATAPAQRRSEGRLPSGAGGGSGGSGGSGGPPSGGGGSSAAGTLVSALVGAGTSGGMGALLPVALILTMFGVGAVALRRRRTG